MNLPNTDTTLPLAKQRSVWFSLPLLAVGVCVAIGFLTFFMLAAAETYTASQTVTVNASQVVDSFQFETISNGPNISTAALPAQLVIPSIGVAAQVQTVGLADGGEMGVPDNFTDVGWYQYGPRPGMAGSAVIAGHLNGKGVPEAVFFDLGGLDIGDRVNIIAQDGSTLTFEVVQMRTYTHDAPTEEVFVSTDGKARLNLITCAGDWMQNEKLYDKRTVVFTELVSQGT
jgi:LPXTG-site transpeptidase (sortase) family protein